MTAAKTTTAQKRCSMLGLVLGMGASIVGCGPWIVGPTEQTDDGMVSFSGRIQPIFTTNCGGCHSPGGGADLFGIRLQLTEDVSYDLLVDQPSVQRSDLTLVLPGDSASSLLVAKVSSDPPPVGVRMPTFAPPLTKDEIDLIRAWIDQGALDN